METYYKISKPDKLPPRRKTLSDYSIRVIGVFSETLVDVIHYNYHKNEWSYSDGDDFSVLKLQYWIEPMILPTNEEKENFLNSVRNNYSINEAAGAEMMYKWLLSKLK